MALHILIADDDDGDRLLFKRVLKQAGLTCTFSECTNVSQALEACRTQVFDCAILDYRLPGQDGLVAISALRERHPHLAIIMVTGQGDEMVATEAMKRGALDYMPKNLVTAQSIRRSLENALEKSGLMKTVARQREDLEIFSRVLVHDLKAPIHRMLGFARVTQECIEEGTLEDVPEYCRALVRAAERMEALIDTLQRYTTAEEQVVFEKVEMRDLMGETLANMEDLIQKSGAKVTYGELPAVSGTPQLGQLLQNLVSNAIKYCDAQPPVVHIDARKQEANLWRFSVKDNGIGIPEKYYQRVFEPFSRLHGEGKYSGTGLGLATCKKIVDRHRGVISCESKEGQGTTFFFTLEAA